MELCQCFQKLLRCVYWSHQFLSNAYLEVRCHGFGNRRQATEIPLRPHFDYLNRDGLLRVNHAATDRPRHAVVNH